MFTIRASSRPFSRLSDRRDHGKKKHDSLSKYYVNHNNDSTDLWYIANVSLHNDFYIHTLNKISSSIYKKKTTKNLLLSLKLYNS